MRTVEQILALDNPNVFTHEECCVIIEEAEHHIDRLQYSLAHVHPGNVAYVNMKSVLPALQKKLALFHLWGAATARFGEIGLKRSA